MKTAIIYASKHGTTEKVAHEISHLLPGHDISFFNIGKSHKVDLTPFDQVYIGGSIHAGGIQKSLQRFINRKTTMLLQRKVGLFLCCMDEKEAQNQFNAAFPEIIRHHASSGKWVGGEYIFEKMNFLEKAMTRKITGINQSISKIKTNQIQELVREMAD